MILLFYSFLNSFLNSKCFVLFDINFYLNFLVYHQNLPFFTKLAISLLLAKIACANLVAKFSAVNLLFSGVVIY